MRSTTGRSRSLSAAAVSCSRHSSGLSCRDVCTDDHWMWKLYEDFVAGFYSRQSRYRVAHGRQIPWRDLSGPGADQMPIMEADLVLELPDRCIILDTKFYSETFGGRFGGKLHSKNLYQLLAYLRNRQVGKPAGARHDGILLYPTIDEAVRVDVVFDGFRIQARSIDLATCWPRIHRELLEVDPGG